MEKLKVNLDSWHGKVLNIFLLNSRPKTTCSAFWTVIICSTLWILQAIILLVVPVYIYGAYSQGTLTAVGPYIMENLSTLWFYPFSDPFLSGFHELLLMFVILEGTILVMLCVVTLIFYSIEGAYVLSEKYPAVSAKLVEFKRNPGIIRSSFKDFRNKVCRPISWTRKHNYD